MKSLDYTEEVYHREKEEVYEAYDSGLHSRAWKSSNVKLRVTASLRGYVQLDRHSECQIDKPSTPVELNAGSPPPGSRGS